MTLEEAIKIFEQELGELEGLKKIHAVTHEDFAHAEKITQLMEWLKELKAVHEIIRCKDCKHRDPEDKKCDCGHDILWQLPRQDDWFCADAERREDE